MTLEIGDKFKTYEHETRTAVPFGYMVMRFDGSGFSKFTRQFERPYSERFMQAMDVAAEALLKSIPGALFTYVQSDEISVVVGPENSEQATMWRNGNSQKLISLGAATVTAHFNHAVQADQLAVFDGRYHPLPVNEIEEYVRWRRADAQRNAITMAAHSLRTHSELENVPTRERHRILEGTHLERLPEGFFNGRVVHRAKVERPVPVEHQKPGEPTTVLRTTYVVTPATREFMEDTFLTLLP